MYHQNDGDKYRYLIMHISILAKHTKSLRYFMDH